VLGKKHSHIKLRSAKAKAELHFKITSVVFAVISLICIVFFGKKNSDNLNINKISYFTAAFDFPFRCAVKVKFFLFDLVEFYQVKNELLEQNAKLINKLESYENIASENAYLTNNVNLANQNVSNMIYAREIFFDSIKSYSILNKGLKDGLHEGDVVFKSQSLLGRIIKVYPDHCFVLLINSENFRLPAKVQLNDKSFVFGVFVGGANPKILYTDRIDAELEDKDLFTSGENSISIANIYIGKTGKFNSHSELSVKLDRKGFYKDSDIVSIAFNKTAFITPEGPEIAMRQAIEDGIIIDELSDEPSQTQEGQANTIKTQNQTHVKH
jgi:cell shape-determining protein MreC